MSAAFEAPLLFDGAFGTYYFSLTGDERPCELANLTAPGTVRGIHRAYIEAGARAVKANTFGANPRLLPDRARLREVLAAGWENACEAAKGGGARVFADLGGNDAESAQEDYLAVVEELLGLGAREFLFETLPSFEPILPALRLLKERRPDAAVIVSFAVAQDGYSRRGLYYQRLLADAAGCPWVDAVGLNCLCGPSHMLALAKKVDLSGKPFSAMPNAGYPSSLNGRVFYEDNTDYFAQKLADLSALGVRILGGCCGSTPEHIRRAASAIRRAASCAPPPQGRKDRPEPAPKAREGRFAASPGKLIAVEVDPPLDADCSFVLSAARELKGCGADLLTVADSPLSRTRASSVMVAAKLRREVGIEVMPHLACRDRNRIAIKGCLLGAAFEGIGRVLAVTGDPLQDPRRSDGVFNFNSFDLISFIDSLNTDALAAHPIAPAGALNVNAARFGVELDRAKKKIARGARLLLTQPIFSDKAVENFLLAKRTLDCPILAGILPVAGYKNALFLTNEVSGIEIPDAVLESLRGKSREEAAEISVAYSAGILRRVYDAADGFYIMTPLRRVDIVRGLIEEIHRLGAV